MVSENGGMQLTLRQRKRGFNPLLLWGADKALRDCRSFWHP